MNKKFPLNIEGFFLLFYVNNYDIILPNICLRSCFMVQNISSKQMYDLISEAVSESFNFKDMDVSTKIKSFSDKH
jgi:hypothetical protein